MLTSLLLLATAQFGQPKVTGPITAPKGKPITKFSVPGPLLFVLPLVVQPAAQDGAYDGLTDGLQKGFVNGLFAASKLKPMHDKETRVVSPFAVADALKKHPKTNSGTPAKPQWNPAELCKVASTMGANFVVLAYVMDYGVTMNKTEFEYKVPGLMTAWSVKTGKTVFGDERIGGRYVRPITSGALFGGDFGYLFGNEDVPNAFYDIYTKDRWPEK